MPLQRPLQLVPHLRRHRARRDHVADDLGSAAVVLVLLEVNERQRHLSFAQVAADWLADRLGVAGEVEQVVDDLERHAEIEAVLPPGRRALAGQLVQHAADLRAAAEQVRRLAAHDVEMLVLGDVGVAVLRQLIELALDHPQRDVTEQPDDLQLVVRERHRHRLDVQVVAEQDRDVVAPPRMHGEAPAAQVGVVDDVIVDERRRVDELDDRRIQDGAVALVAAEARRHQQHGRPDPFPAAGLDVLPDLRNQLDPRLHVPRKLLVHLLQVGADRLEDLRQGWRRFFHSVCWSELYHGLNSVWKFAAVRAARSAGGIPYTTASVSTTRATYAGSFRLPRYGT